MNNINADMSKFRVSYKYDMFKSVGQNEQEESLFSFDSTNSNSRGISLESSVGESEGDNLAKMAYFDRNNDGYISEDEAEQESFAFILQLSGVTKEGTLGGCGTSIIKAEYAGNTIVNGHKVYAVGNMRMGATGSASFSEEEMCALDSYYCQNGDKADINGAAKAMGVEIDVSKDSDGNIVISFVGQSGVKTQITTNPKLGWVNDENEALWYVYSLIKSNYRWWNRYLDHKAIAEIFDE